MERDGCALVCKRVDTPAATEAALRRQAWDVVICDYTLPHFDFSAALALVKAFDPDLPFILVSGTVGEEIAVACMKAGAHDYVMKNNLPRLLPAIERELREAEVRRQRRRALEELTASEDRYRLLFERNVAGILRSTLQGKILDCNEAFARCSATPRARRSRPIRRGSSIHSARTARDSSPSCRSNAHSFSHEFCFRHKDGSPVHVLANVSLEEEGSEAVIHGTIVDITDRKNAERRMAMEHAVARVLAESAVLADAAPEILQAIGDELGWDLGALWTVDRSRRRAALRGSVARTASQVARVCASLPPAHLFPWDRPAGPHLGQRLCRLDSGRVPGDQLPAGAVCHPGGAARGGRFPHLRRRRIPWRHGVLQSGGPATR